MNFSKTKVCLNCNKVLTGRSDKKFCDSYCRNSFNNQFQSDEEQLIKAINALIRKNRKILKMLCPQGKATVRKEVLDKLGYDYRYFSSVFKTSANVYYLAYDFGFSPIVEGGVEKALIIRKQSYADKLGFEIWK